MTLETHRPNPLVYFQIFLISSVILCFEIVATRISSLIFVNNSAFIILSLAILGLGLGGMYAYYRIRIDNPSYYKKAMPIFLVLLGLSLLAFILVVTQLEVDAAPVAYFVLMFLPFFFAGIFFAWVFKIFAAHSFNIFTADLVGAALGPILAIIFINIMGAGNSVLFLSFLVFLSSSFFLFKRKKTGLAIVLSATLVISLSLLIMNGDKKVIGSIPIGDFPEKDFHHVYPDPTIKSRIIDSRWSINGRADLVQYSHQDMVKQLFVDGAAGSQMMRFDGNVENVSPLLVQLLYYHSTSIPFVFLKENEKNSMLVIGPGGGKEVLTGLLQGVNEITGVEINRDFVDIVKDYREFNGGIYTDFLNVRIFVKEGRHFIRQTYQKFDIITMALPSTEQVQNVENLSMSENYLLTSEAIREYLDILTPEGRLIFTVHNQWELLRLLITTVIAFEELDVAVDEIPEHLIVLEDEFAPTLVIKKKPFTKDEVSRHISIAKQIPEEFPAVTHFPFHVSERNNSHVSQLLEVLKSGGKNLDQFIHNHQYNIEPCRDDSPFFYNVNKGIPDYLMRLLIGIVILNLFMVFIPVIWIRKGLSINKFSKLRDPLIILISTGIGFMILEISLFQKLILFLGAPTISLAILLSSMLMGMGVGSYTGQYFFVGSIRRRLYISSLLIVIYGIILFSIHPFILDKILGQALAVRALVSGLLIIPLAFFLGIPFPATIQLMKKSSLERYIPWMYGINGTMAVLGSVMAAIFSMLIGITVAFYMGLGFYAIISLYVWLTPQSRF